MQSHDVDYTITGDDLQFVEVELDPGETVIGEGGTMMFIEDGITFETKMATVRSRIRACSASSRPQESEPSPASLCS